MSQHPIIGKQLGNYVARSLLGEGGMGAVFAGEHRFLGTQVAIKVLHGSYANNPTVTQRFFQEAKSSIEINHPGIVKILDFGQADDGALYLVMELLEGHSLAALVAGGPMIEPQAARIAAAIADGMAAAHEKGIVHRDLKPDNVFITGEQVKILDFGIAKILTSNNSTKTGSILGTPYYMAPEQCKSSKYIGPYTDIYALGAILFEMVCGRPPFIGDEMAEILVKHLMEPPPRPAELVALSPELEAIILQCLEKEPKSRPASMLELRDRLARHVVAVDPSAQTLHFADPAPRSGGFAMAARRATDQAASPPRKSISTLSGAASEVIADQGTPSSRRRVVIAVVGALSLATAVLGVSRARHGSPPEPVKPAAAPAAAAAPVPVPTLPAAPKLAKVVVRTDPPGATVTVDGEVAGLTPTMLSLPLPQTIRLSLAGFQPAEELLAAAGEVSFKLISTRPSPAPVHSAKKRAAPAPTAAPAAPAPAPPKPAPRRTEGLD